MSSYASKMQHGCGLLRSIRLAGPLLTSIILVSMVPMTFPFDHLWNHTVISPQLILEAALIVLAAIGC